MSSQLFVRDSGERDLPCVLFLHAFPLHSGQWENEAEALRGRFRTLRPDMRGMGQSLASRWPAFFDHWVDDVLAVLDERAVGAVEVVGLSMGGYLALRLTERAPERIRGLFLASTQASADSDPARLKRAEGVRQLQEHSLSRYASDFLRSALGPTTQQEQPELANLLTTSILDNSKEGVVGALVAMATRTDTTAVLPNLRVPVTVLAGSEDALIAPAVMEELARATPGANFHLVQGAGHLINLEKPEIFSLLLTQHLRL